MTNPQPRRKIRSQLRRLITAAGPLVKSKSRRSHQDRAPGGANSQKTLISESVGEKSGGSRMQEVQ